MSIQRNKKSKMKVNWDDHDINNKNVLERSNSADDEKLFHDAAMFGKIIRKDETIERSNFSPIPAKKKIVRHNIDLHGLTVAEAQNYVVKAIEDLLASAKGQIITIRVITGKGHRSRDRSPQLVHAIHHIVEARFKSRLISIEVSPHELKLGDSYFKGHFDLKIR